MTPEFCIMAAICVVLLPGAAVISRIDSPCCGFKMIAGSMLDKLCKYNRPSVNTGSVAILWVPCFLTINASWYHGMDSTSHPSAVSSDRTDSFVAFRVFIRNVVGLGPLNACSIFSHRSGKNCRRRSINDWGNTSPGLFMPSIVHEMGHFYDIPFTGKSFGYPRI